LAFCVFLFGYGTLIGWAYYGEQFLEYWLGPRVVMPYRWIYCLFIPLGAVAKVNLVWAWGDLMNALQIFPNLIGVLARRFDRREEPPSTYRLDEQFGTTDS
jgi:AGCS family alanine or glycine:cation symporter